MDPGLQEGLAGGIMADVRRDDDSEIDAVFAGSFCLCHFIKRSVAAVICNAQLRARLLALLKRTGEAACDQCGHAVNIDRAAVCITNKGTGAAAHHTIAQFFHTIIPISVICPLFAARCRRHGTSHCLNCLNGKETAYLFTSRFFILSGNRPALLSFTDPVLHRQPHLFCRHICLWQPTLSRLFF